MVVRLCLKIKIARISKKFSWALRSWYVLGIYIINKLGHQVLETQKKSQKIQRNIHPELVLNLCPSKSLWSNIGFRGCILEVNTLLWTPITMSWHHLWQLWSLCQYRCSGHIRDLAIVAIVAIVDKWLYWKNFDYWRNISSDHLHHHS